MSTQNNRLCPYATLELVREEIEQRDQLDSTNETKLIKQKYVELARKYHPDLNPDIGHYQFQKITSAFSEIKTFNDRQNFKNANPVMTKNRPLNSNNQQLTVYKSSVLVPLDTAFSIYENTTEISDEEFVNLYAKFIIDKGGFINMTFGHKEFLALNHPFYQQKMVSMGNVKQFCSDYPCFSYNEDGKKGGAKVTYTQMMMIGGGTCGEGVSGDNGSSGRVGGGNGGSDGVDGDVGGKLPPPPPTPPTVKRNCKFFQSAAGCRKGSKCKFLHQIDNPEKSSNVQPPSRPRHVSVWDNKVGHKKIIILGGSGHGKSTFINSIHNFFRGTTVDNVSAVIPTMFLKASGVHSEAGGSNVNSQTQSCNEYKFTNPNNRNVSITFVDTPGLGDTRGAAQDEINMKMILDIAATCECNNTLSGIIFVIRGSEKRASLTIKTITTILNCSLPDTMFDDIVVIFTMSPTPSYAREAEALVPFHVKTQNKFYFDNPMFEVQSVRSMVEYERIHYTSCWDRTMSQMADIVNTVFSHKVNIKSGVAEMQARRMKLSAVFHEIKLNISNLQAVQQNIEASNAALESAKSMAASNKNYKSTEVMKQKVLVDCAQLNTLCSTCNHACHAPCSLTEITEKGSNAFLGCAAFGGSTNCRICPEHCSHSTHYHARKNVVEQEVSKEKVTHVL